MRGCMMDVVGQKRRDENGRIEQDFHCGSPWLSCRIRRTARRPNASPWAYWSRGARGRCLRNTTRTIPFRPVDNLSEKREARLHAPDLCAPRGTAMILVACSGCQKKLSIKDELAGKRIKC